ncbi:MAG: YceI family protein [Planctomycetes bacterium]|nr:YceI family protein [Planctomycetota bacterium]
MPGMLQRALSWVGLFAILALAGFGAGALALVKDRISVTIEEGDGDASPDPLALVRDELDQVHGDLRAIAEGLSTNLTKVAGALEEQSLASSEQFDAIEKRLSSMLAQLQELRAAADAAPMNVAVEVSEPIDPPTPERSEPPSEEPEPRDVPVAVEAPKARGGFLSFSLPSNSFAFDKPQHYRIVPSLSRVGFDAKSTLHDFTGVTSNVTGEIDANLADPNGKWYGTVSCEAKTLRTGVEGRDENMFEHLATDEHPDITFEVDRFVPDAGAIDVASKQVRGKIHGSMTIRGVSREVAMPVTIKIDDRQRAVVSGQMKLALTDYEVPVPSKLGLISMEDLVNVWVELRARSTGPAVEHDEH